MAKKAMVLKQQKKQKFSTREYNRCKICGRPHGIFASTVFAVSASVNSLTADKSQA